jgi:hypothetical protein
MFRIGEPPVLLCLDCQHKFSQIANLDFLKQAALLNHALDEMDSVLPIPPFSGRMPVAEIARAMQKAPTFNNISVANSQIGILNTGHIQKIDAAITLTQGSDAQVVGEHIQALTEAVAKASELDDGAKREIIELIEGVATEVVGPRKQPVITALMKDITARVNDIATLAGASYALWEAIKHIIGG